MAASVRITAARAATAPVGSVGQGRSFAASAASVRIAGITAQSIASAASVRIGGITALTVTTSLASIRIADITAFTPSASYTWNGTAWVLAAAPTVAVSVGIGTSIVTGTNAGHGSSTGSVAKGSSAVTSTITRTGTLALSGAGSLVLGPPGGTTGNDKSGITSLSGTGTLTLVGTASQGPLGAGSMSVFPEPDSSPPRMRLALTGALGPTAAIMRVDAQGNSTPVRTANPGALSSGSWSGYDYEAPFNETVKYVATASLVITSDPFVLTVGQPWLIHPGIPDLSQPVLVQNVPTRSRDTNQGVHNVLGRTAPIVITDGVRRAPTFDLVLRTDTFDSLYALDALLNDASVLLLQIAYADVPDRQDYDWVAIGTAAQESMVDYYGDPYTQWTLACTVTDNPILVSAADRTLADLAAEFSTLGDLALNYATLADVITDNLIGS